MTDKIQTSFPVTVHSDLPPMQGYRPIRRDDLSLFGLLPEVAASVRDEALALVWCNAWFASMTGIEAPRLMGRRRSDLIAASGAKERDAIDYGVLATGRPHMHFQLCADRRVLTTVTPLDEASFGHGGVLIVTSAVSARDGRNGGDGAITLQTPALVGALGGLTRRELEVLRLAGGGMSAPQIGEVLFRSSKTMEHHISSIHAKLGMRSKGELIRFCVERGLHGFSRTEWDRIVLAITAGEPEASE